MPNTKPLPASSPDRHAERNVADYAIVEYEEFLRQRSDSRQQAISRQKHRLLWTVALNAILGIWLINGPFLCDYGSRALSFSDVISGSFIVAFELLSLLPFSGFLRWGTAAVGFWLLLAPLIYWAPAPSVYLVDSIIGAMVICFSLLVPGVPNRGDVALSGPDQPPGWSYNPSSWIRRWLGIALALFGFFISRYLSAYQLGYIDHAVDPFFGHGTEKVLTSVISRSLPVSDAGLGAVAYVMEVLTGFMGDRARWRSAPWIVLMFALLVVPLGATSILLVIMQPLIVHNWCGLCLIAAVALLISVPLAVHEVVAVGQFLYQAKKQGKDFWQVFWMGGTIISAGKADPDRTGYSMPQLWIASIQGVTVPWTLIIQTAIGIWLMAAPGIIPTLSWSVEDASHILGALIVTTSAIATAEVTRTVRFFNIPLGCALLIVACVWARGFPAVFWSEIIAAVLLVFLSIPKGEIVEKYASWNKKVI